MRQESKEHHNTPRCLVLSGIPQRPKTMWDGGGREGRVKTGVHMCGSTARGHENVKYFLTCFLTTAIQKINDL